MITAHMDGLDVHAGRLPVMKESVLRKAREHCAQENKAIKLVRQGPVTKTADGPNAFFGGDSHFALGSALGMAMATMPGAGFDIVFTCRERTTPAAAPPSKETP